jgi:hypothetical protein
MFSSLRRACSSSNLIAGAALFVALGGTSYAAIKIPHNSVGNGQLRTNAVTSSKVKDHSLTRQDLATPLDADTVGGQSAAAFAPANHFTFGQGRLDIAGTQLGASPKLGVTVSTTNTGKVQLVVANQRSSGNLIGAFQLYNKPEVPFSLNPGTSIVTGDTTVNALSAGHLTVTITSDDQGSNYELNCLASAIGGKPTIRCFGITT